MTSQATYINGRASNRKCLAIPEDETASLSNVTISSTSEWQTTLSSTSLLSNLGFFLKKI